MYVYIYIYIYIWLIREYYRYSVRPRGSQDKAFVGFDTSFLVQGLGFEAADLGNRIKLCRIRCRAPSARCNRAW